MILPYQQQTFFSITIVTKQRQRSKKNYILFPSHVALRATLKHRRLQDPDRSWNITRKKRENRGHGCLPPSPPAGTPGDLLRWRGGGDEKTKHELISTARSAIAITPQLFVVPLQ